MPGLIAAVLDLVWPLACGGCERPGARWCRDCAALLGGPAAPARPTPSPPGLPPVWAVTAYDGPVRRAVISWKDEGRHDLTGPFAAGLRSSLTAALEHHRPATPIWVVPMPSRGRARRDRGADPVRELAQRAVASVRRAGWELRVVPALRHRRAVADQSGLDAAGRAANLAGALEVRPTLRDRAAGAACVLVDDVVTTGATLAEGAAALRRVGADPAGAAVLAATQRTARRTRTAYGVR
ncbi:MAG: ComF family protein [Actinomycetales bacterium]